MTQDNNQIHDDFFSFFNVNYPIFSIEALSGENLKRFTDREELLRSFKTALESRKTCAIVGKQGTGKSSFLHKLLEIMEDNSKYKYCQYLNFSFPINELENSRLHFLRTILRSILVVIGENPELLELFERKELELERKRLEYSIIIENEHRKLKKVGAETGAETQNILKLLVPIDFKAKFSGEKATEDADTESIDYPVHNEHTLVDSIIKITKKLHLPLILFIDEMDKVGRFPLEDPIWDQEVIKILELSREIMANDKIVMVFSLQHDLYNKLMDAKKGKGDVSIMGLINYFKKIEGFDLEFARQVVDKSLEYAGYTQAASDLLEKGVIEIVHAVVKGNPRLFLTYLSELTEEAYHNNEKTVSLQLLKKFLFDLFTREEFDESKWDALLKKFT